jgi:membrane-associated protein
MTLAVDVTNGGSVLSAFGALGVLVVIFSECGLLVVGFFLPGDTLLVPAGVLCSAGHHSGSRLSLWQVLLCAAVGSVAGAQVGYLIGRHGGRSLLARSSGGRLKRGTARAEELLARYGYGRAIMLGRFIPLVRTVLNPVAGMLGVPVRTFTWWQIAAGLLWSQSLVLAGYALGASFPDLNDYLLPLIAVIVLISSLPVLIGARRSHRRPPDDPPPPQG